MYKLALAFGTSWSDGVWSDEIVENTLTSVLTFLGLAFGGATCFKTKGSYIGASGTLVLEDGFTVWTVSDNNDELLRVGTEVANDIKSQLKQESVLLVVSPVEYLFV